MLVHRLLDRPFSNASERDGSLAGMFAMRMAHWADARPTSAVSSLPLVVCALVTASSLVLGGGTRSGLLSDALLQLLSIPLLLASLWQPLRAHGGERGANPLFRAELAFCAALVGVPLVQLIPLPPAIWTTLPNRQSVVEAFELVGGDLPWMPISLSPEATWLGALSLIPPVAVFLSTRLLSYAERRLMSLLVLAMGLCSVFLGLLQVAQGAPSPLRFFATTNTSEAVGLFANRNHFAAFVYALVLIAACWATAAVFRARTSFNRKVHDTTAVAAVVMTAAIIIVLLSAEAMARSRAGLALTTLALIGGFGLGWKEWRWMSRGAAGLVLGLIALTCLFVAEFTLYRILERFATDPLEDSRITFARNTLAAVMEYMPFGSGIGSFVPVYGMYERPGDVMINAYANHAHNDILEIALEAGIFGIVLTAFFAVWMTKASVAIWRSSIIGSRNIDLWLARSATIIVVLVAFHSLVDYPLRTGAIMAIVAFACGLLVAPPQGMLMEWPRNRKAAASTHWRGNGAVPDSRRPPPRRWRGRPDRQHTVARIWRKCTQSFCASASGHVMPLPLSAPAAGDDWACGPRGTAAGYIARLTPSGSVVRRQHL
jgi:O-antigen ligase